MPTSDSDRAEGNGIDRGRGSRSVVLVSIIAVRVPLTQIKVLRQSGPHLIEFEADRVNGAITATKIGKEP